MAYKPPLTLRLFQYVLWAIMLFVVLWFFVIPLFLRVTAPEPQTTPQPPEPGAYLNQPFEVPGAGPSFVTSSITLDEFRKDAGLS